LEKIHRKFPNIGNCGYSPRMTTRRFLLLLAVLLSFTASAAEEALPRGLDAERAKPFKGDLDAIKERGFIRVLTRNNPACYFIHRGGLMGFEYELVKRFAKQEGLKVVMIVPPKWDDLPDWLAEGRADLIAASKTITENRRNIDGMAFCHPYGKVFEMIVTRPDDDSIKSLNDLAGRTIHVRKSSSYFESLTNLKKQTGIKFRIAPVSEELETFQILEKVANGELDITCADHHFLNQRPGLKDRLKVVLRLNEPQTYGWAVRTDQPELRATVDRFFEKEYRGTTYNILYKRYFYQEAEKRAAEFSSDGPFRISPYDDLVKKYAAQHQMPWTLICAQIHQESRFDPNAGSWAGAKGLMQLMPATAKELGVKNILDPDENIAGGVKYLHQQYKRIPGNVDAFNRACFSLAAYNGGYGHLIDARKLADQKGWDRNLWQGNVQKAYELLSTPKYAQQAKYGYCRSDEIVNYVRDIIIRYEAYDSWQKQQP